MNGKEDLYINGVIWIVVGVVTILMSRRKDRNPGAIVTIDSPVPQQKTMRQQLGWLVLGICQVVLGAANLAKGWLR